MRAGPSPTARCSSSRWPPSSRACTRRRCAATTGWGSSAPAGRSAAGVATPPPTSRWSARGRGGRYSARDIALLREVQRLSQEEGVNLAGIKRIIELEQLIDALQSRVDELLAELDAAHSAAGHAAATGHRSYRRDLVPVDRRHQIVVWHPQRPE